MRAPLPGVCCRCDRVYLAGTEVRPDLGGLIADCCIDRVVVYRPHLFSRNRRAA